jgi:hypothetical protein
MGPSLSNLVSERPLTRLVRLKVRAEKVDRSVDQTLPFPTKELILGEETGELALARRINPNQARLHAKRGDHRWCGLRVRMADLGYRPAASCL